MAKTAAGAEAYTSEDHDYWTPPEVVEAILDFENIVEFDLDPCASVYGDNIPAKVRYTVNDNGLAQEWKGQYIWINPPFGRLMQDFMKRAMAHHLSNPSTIIWAIVPSTRFETSYYHRILRSSDFTFLIEGKLKYGNRGDFKDKATFGSMLVRWGRGLDFRAGRFLDFVQSDKKQRLKGTLIIPKGGTR